jgi:hypothetical protein
MWLNPEFPTPKLFAPDMSLIDVGKVNVLELVEPNEVDIAENKSP